MSGSTRGTPTARAARLASAAATGLSQGLDLVAAVRRAGDFVHEAIRTAPGLGRGHGPLNHRPPM